MDLKQLISRRQRLMKRVHQLAVIANELEGHPEKIPSFQIRFADLTAWTAEFDEIQSKIEIHPEYKPPPAELEDLVDSFDDEVYFIKQMSRIHDPVVTTAQQPAEAVSRSHVRLPQLELPTYDGDIATWTSFADIFSSLIEQNTTLSLIEKFHYLKLSVKGEPFNLIKNLPVNADNYPIAWNMLAKRYDNKRLIITNHIDKVIAIPTITNPSLEVLKEFVNTINENIAALNVLTLPADNKLSQMLLVTLIVRKLDCNTRHRWELTLPRNDLPSFTSLMSFLETQVGVLESMVDNGAETTSVIKTRSTNFISRTKNQSGQAFGSSRSTFNIETPKRSTFRTTLVTHNDVQFNCVLCNSPHSLYKCSKFLNKQPKKRFELARSKKLSLNCLKASHTVASCPSTITCGKCNKRHHTLLHFPSKETATSVTQSLASSSHSQASDDKVTDKETTTAVLLTGFTPAKTTVVLATVKIEVGTSNGQWKTVRALLDCASQANYITESCQRKLGLKRRRLNTPIFALGGIQLDAARGLTSCTIRPLRQATPAFLLPAIVVKSISSQVPSLPLEIDKFPHLAHIPLADPQFGTPDAVDMLIGAEMFPHLLRDGRLVGDPGTPTALNTIFGWTVMGAAQSTTNIAPSTFHLTMDLSLDEAIRKFWELEEVYQVTLPLSIEDTQCEKIYKDTVHRDLAGRYCVSLSFRSFPPILGNSYRGAPQCYQSLQRRLAANPALRREYVDFLADYRDTGHMKLVKLSKDNQFDGYYIPHHCVLKPDSITTKLRVVFNASKSSNINVSLNDTLFSGPALQQDLSAILLRFRCHAFVITADVRQMYRQIQVDPAHHRYQRILWYFDSNQPPETYELTTVTYGMNCAPYLALRTLKQLAYDEGERFPRAVQVLNQDTYVDDVIGGADTIEDAVALQLELSTFFATGCFELRKWTSNSPEVLKSLPSSHKQMPNGVLDLDKTFTVKILGLHWNPASDNFSYCIQPMNRGCTKRVILSEVARIFDPQGWLSPLSFLAKRMIQRLWTLKLGWDESPPLDIVNQWDTFREQLPLLSQLEIPRQLMRHDEVIDLVGFCDASEAEYSAVIYIRPSTSSSTSRLALLCAKSRVAPLKRISTPRLELCAALLLARLIKFVKQSLTVNIKKLYTWSDSTVTLHWVRSPPHRWKTFVCNRVTEIQSVIDPHCWNHVRSEDNPADCASRGLLPAELLLHHSYWNGPKWLTNSPDSWVVDASYMNSTDVIEEETVEEAKFTLTTTTLPTFNLLNNTSNLMQLLRITAYCFRFIKRCKSRDINFSPFITAKELDNSMNTWVKITQASYFSDSIALIKCGKSCSRHIQRLSPFIDPLGILKVGGRLSQASIAETQKHPMLLPQHCRFTNLIIDYYHRLYLHPGPQALQSLLARKFWILSARNIIRQRLFRCKECFKCKPTSTSPIMGDLPAQRVTQLKPFRAVGVDYAGPFLVTFSRTRGIKTHKAYLCLFVCFATKALHLELASDLSTDAFLAAFRRFISRRGRCSHIYSDCGTNFVGAKRELANMYAVLRSTAHNQTMATELANEGIEWLFNPPSAPHFGGLWEAGVKSVKTHLYRVIGDRILTYEELNTVLVQIEALLNSRPLCALSTDPNDYSALTPGHFLVHEPLVCLPDSNYLDSNINRLSRWQLLQQMQQHFWKRWHSEYLNTLQQRNKWTKNTAPIVEGTLVLIRDNLTPPIIWRLGRIVRTFPGADNVVRVAEVRTKNGVITRPIVKLCPLPYQDVDNL